MFYPAVSQWRQQKQRWRRQRRGLTGGMQSRRLASKRLDSLFICRLVYPRLSIFVVVVSLVSSRPSCSNILASMLTATDFCCLSHSSLWTSMFKCFKRLNLVYRDENLLCDVDNFDSDEQATGILLLFECCPLNKCCVSCERSSVPTNQSQNELLLLLEKSRGLDHRQTSCNIVYLVICCNRFSILVR